MQLKPDYVEWLKSRVKILDVPTDTLNKTLLRQREAIINSMATGSPGGQLKR